MRSLISNLIQEKWQESEAPIMDGLLFSDGRYFVASYLPICIGGISGSGAHFAATLSQLGPKINWTAITELASETQLETGLKYSCGEGGFGADGFVAAARMSTGELIWIAFFQQSNPFVAIKLDKEQLVAANNHGHHWSFSLENPLDLKIF